MLMPMIETAAWIASSMIVEVALDVPALADAVDDRREADGHVRRDSGALVCGIAPLLSRLDANGPPRYPRPARRRSAGGAPRRGAWQERRRESHGRSSCVRRASWGRRSPSGRRATTARRRSRSRTTPSCATPGFLGPLHPRALRRHGRELRGLHAHRRRARALLPDDGADVQHAQPDGALDGHRGRRPRPRRRTTASGTSASRAALYRGILEDGAIHAPAALGGHRARRDGRRHDDGRRPSRAAGWINGRKVFASLAGAADAYNLTCLVPGEEGLRFLSVRSDNAGRAHRRRLGPARHARHRLAHAASSRTPSSRPTTSCCRPASSTSSPSAGRYVYLTLTPTYIGLTRAVVDFVQGYLGGAAPPGIAARRDVPPKQWAWAEIQIAARAQPRRSGSAPSPRPALDPTPEQLRRALGGALHGDGDRARGGRARRSAPAAAAR